MSNELMTLPRVTGLLVIEVRESNPNGDPDNEGEPRMRGHNERGVISGVSFKRKLRDLVEAKDGPVWMHLASELGIDERKAEFEVLESRGRDRIAIGNMKKADFQKAYWDARLFGTTFLESIKEDKSKDVEHFIRCGVVQFSNGLSVAPIRIHRQTNTNKAGVQEGKDRGMAPLGYRIVEHGIYVMPFFVNPTAALKSGCKPVDLELLKKLIPIAYPQTASAVRPLVETRHAWWIEHKSPLGSCSDFALIDALTPKKKEKPDEASSGIDEYDVPNGLPDELKSRVASIKDLMNG
ncbi:type I CRISPR-associated protein Cas7 [Armatimonas sp.]|uniref:type I CRISPR-associated protein Cas7 n=1 Tax=Armatimonas sp. TaxID=1872638 RepID=UPI0037517B3C